MTATTPTAAASLAAAPLASGPIDLQVNGYAGVDFNSDPRPGDPSPGNTRGGLTAEGLRLACERLAADGVEAILATIITDHVDVMAGRLRRLVELREKDELARKLIVGIHIEGPFLNEVAGYRGAHPVDAIHPANPEEMRRLLNAAGGLTKLVTLAPDRDPGLEVTRLLSRQGIVVSAGHCDPSLEQLDAAIDAGLSMFTHLGNGCPMQMHRHDNIIQRALSRADRLHLCFIADGVHVPLFVLGNYLKLAGLERAIVVTDAIAAAGLGPGRHRIGRWEVEVGQDLSAWAPDRSHLVGSAMTMPQNHHNLREGLGLDDAAIARLTRDNPRKAIGL